MLALLALALLLGVAPEPPPPDPPDVPPPPAGYTLYVHDLNGPATTIPEAMAPMTTFCWLGGEVRGANQVIGIDFEKVVGNGGWGQAGVNLDVHRPRMLRLGYDPDTEAGRVAYAAEVLFPEQGIGPWNGCNPGALGHD